MQTKLFEVHFGKAVRKVKYRPKGGVSVYTKKGLEYRGDAVLCTVPLGVLKAGDIEFEPPLPTRKTSAIRNTGMGNLCKLVLKFPSHFWGDDEVYFGLARDIHSETWAEASDEDMDEESLLEELCKPLFANGASERGRFFLWWNLHAVCGENVLVALSSGTQADVVESMQGSQVAEEAFAWLRKRFGEDIPRPTTFKVTQWGKDEFSKGCYHYKPVGSNGAADIKAIGRSHGDVLFFAGEHTSFKHPDTVGGALLEGLRAAGDIEGVGKLWPTSFTIPAANGAFMLEKERKRERNIAPVIDETIARQKREVAASKHIETMASKQRVSSKDYKAAVTAKSQVIRVSSEVMKGEVEGLLSGDAFDFGISNDRGETSSLDLPPDEPSSPDPDSPSLGQASPQNDANLPVIESFADAFGLGDDASAFDDIEFIDSAKDKLREKQREKRRKKRRKRKKGKGFVGKHKSKKKSKRDSNASSKKRERERESGGRRRDAQRLQK